VLEKHKNGLPVTIKTTQMKALEVTVSPTLPHRFQRWLEITSHSFRGLRSTVCLKIRRNRRWCLVGGISYRKFLF